MLYEYLLPVIVAGVAMVMDLRTARVDNGWIVFSLCTGFAFQFAEQGIKIFPGYLAGVTLPLVLLGGLFLFRMLGPGDVKLFCALGSIMGAAAVGKCILVSLIPGAFLSLAILISTGSICQRFHYFIGYLWDCLSAGQRKPYYQKEITSPENFHFTVPVFLSVALYAGGFY